MATANPNPFIKPNAIMCKEMTKAGTNCKNSAHKDGMCIVHYNKIHGIRSPKKARPKKSMANTQSTIPYQSKLFPSSNSLGIWNPSAAPIPQDAPVPKKKSPKKKSPKKASPKKYKSPSELSKLCSGNLDMVNKFNEQMTNSNMSIQESKYVEPTTISNPFKTQRAASVQDDDTTTTSSACIVSNVDPSAIPAPYSLSCERRHLSPRKKIGKTSLLPIHSKFQRTKAGSPSNRDLSPHRLRIGKNHC